MNNIISVADKQTGFRCPFVIENTLNNNNGECLASSPCEKKCLNCNVNSQKASYN